MYWVEDKNHDAERKERVASILKMGDELRAKFESMGVKGNQFS